MIPRNIKSEQILKAVAEIDQYGVPPKRCSVYYDLVIKQNSYPPKYVISIANKYVNGSELLPNSFDAVEAKVYLSRLKFQVNDRRGVGKTTIADEDDESAYPEGRVQYRMHREFERNSKIVKSKKEVRGIPVVTAREAVELMSHC